MSVFYNIGRNPKPDFVEINVEFIAVRELKLLISSKTGVGESDLKIKSVISGVEYAPNEYIKRGSSVSVDITARSLQDEPLRFHEIVTEERLAQMLQDCRFYIVKSSNEDNIQKARDCSVWATTYPNQVRALPFRISSETHFNVSSMSSYSSEPIAATSSKDWPGWRASLIKYRISLFGQASAIYGSAVISSLDGSAKSH